MASGQYSRGLFALGGTGAIILSVASVIMAIVGLWSFWMLVYGLWPLWIDTFVWYLILITGLILLLIGSIFVGIANYAFYQHFERPIGIAGLVFGVICSVALLVFAAIGMLPIGNGNYPSLFGLVLYWVGLLLFGTMLVIWGVASIVARKSTSMPDLSLATGIVLIVAGCFVASFFLTFVGFILLIAAQIMNAILLLKMAMSSN